MKKINFLFLIPNFSPINEKLKKNEKRQILVFVQPINIMFIDNKINYKIGYIISGGFRGRSFGRGGGGGYDRGDRDGGDRDGGFGGGRGRGRGNHFL